MMSEESIKNILDSAIIGMAKKLNIDYMSKNNDKVLDEIEIKDKIMFEKLNNFLNTYCEYSDFILKIEDIRKERDITIQEKEKLENLIYLRDNTRKEMDLDNYP